jgi:hypothetical protein
MHMTTIHIRTISKATKTVYVLWSLFIVLVCIYIGLVAASMVYAVEKRIADKASDSYKQVLADHEAKLLEKTGRLSVLDASEMGLAALMSRSAIQGDVRLGRLSR